MIEPVLFISIPKSGTNMITQAITISGVIQIHAVLDNTPHPMPEVMKELRTFEGFARGHIAFHEKYRDILLSRKVKVIFMFRDPRDMIISHKYWILRADDVGGGFMNFDIEPGFPLNKSSDIIGELIKVYPAHVEKFLPWLEYPDVFIIQYEDFLKNKLGIFTDLIHWIPTTFKSAYRCDTPDIMIQRINPKTCVTFRKGIVGEWKAEFTPEQKKIFWKNSKHIMKILGYDEHGNSKNIKRRT